MYKKRAVNRNILSASLIISACILQGCFPAGFRPVSEENKDTSGSFDGRWIAVGQSTASTQRVENWTLRCADRKDISYGPINVSDGEATANLGRFKGEGFVDSSGNFRIEVPIEAEAKESGTSNSTIQDGAVTMIFTGSLAKQTGFLTFGIAQFGNSGCDTSVAYNKISAN